MILRPDWTPDPGIAELLLGARSASDLIEFILGPGVVVLCGDLSLQLPLNFFWISVQEHCLLLRQLALATSPKNQVLSL